jgi:hypothetical protein
MDAGSKSGLKRRSEVTRFFNCFPINVEPYFECEKETELARLRRSGLFLLVPNDKAFLRGKLLLTIDALSDGVKT